MENIKNEIALNNSGALDIKRELSNTDAMFTSLVDDGTRASKAKIYNTISNPTHSLAAVSYTHLDVYKRQTQRITMIDKHALGRPLY